MYEVASQQEISTQASPLKVSLIILVGTIVISQLAVSVILTYSEYEWKNFKSRSRQVQAKIIDIKEKTRTVTHYGSRGKSAQKEELTTYEILLQWEQRKSVIYINKKPSKPIGETITAWVDNANELDIRVVDWNQKIMSSGFMRLIALVISIFIGGFLSILSFSLIKVAARIQNLKSIQAARRAQNIISQNQTRRNN